MMTATATHLPRLALVVLAALVATACSSKAKVREPAALKSIASPSMSLERDWTARVGEGASGKPSGLKLDLAEDALFAADDRGLVKAIDPSTGREIWTVLTKKRVSAGPTAFGELVLLGTRDGEVIALKRKDGTAVWSSLLSSEVMGPPVGSGRVVVARSVDGRIYGLDAGSGARLWSFDRTTPTLTLRGLSAPLIEGNSVLVGLDNGRLVSLKLADGAPQWEQAISNATGRSEIERLTDIDAGLVSTLDGVLAASYGGDVALIEPNSGEPRWKRNIKSYNTPAVGAGNVYVSDADGLVWALDAGSGAVVWKNEDLQYRRLSPPAFFAGKVVVADYKGYVHAIDPASGAIVGRSRAGSAPVLAAPQVTDDHLYLLNAEGRITALKLLAR